VLDVTEGNPGLAHGSFPKGRAAHVNGGALIVNQFMRDAQMACTANRWLSVGTLSNLSSWKQGERITHEIWSRPRNERAPARSIHGQAFLAGPPRPMANARRSSVIRAF
jgi:hypothetical protein